MLGNTIQPIATTAPPATVAQSGFQNAMNNISSVLTNVVKPAADIYTQVSTKPGSTPATTAYAPDVTAPAAALPQQQSGTKKYLIIGGVVILAGTAVYFITRKKKK